MPPAACRYLQMPPDAFRCLPDASRCLQMPPNVSRCLQMLADAFQMPPDASQMLSRCLKSKHPKIQRSKKTIIQKKQ
jgi:hypothetical protein